jgi:hypothetical protein
MVAKGLSTVVVLGGSLEISIRSLRRAASAADVPQVIRSATT